MSKEDYKPILCVDFDGVIHSYDSGWQGVANVLDGPVEGAIYFLYEAVQRFDVQIFSSRSGSFMGRRAMQMWLKDAMKKELGSTWYVTYRSIKWPRKKPPALVTIDDRAIQFDGRFPDFNVLEGFKPWNKQ